jgi:acylphosphatase
MLFDAHDARRYNRARGNIVTMQPSRMRDSNISGSGEASFLQATVRGRVQGVGFRYFVRKEARQLALRGSVRNQPDGTVYVEAAGDRSSLDRLLVLLHKGPYGARVEGVEAHWSSTSNRVEDREFEVLG